MLQTRSAMQGAAMLLLFRFFLFLCSGVPYTAAYAEGMVLASVTQAILLIPMLRKPLLLPEPVQKLLRGLLLLWGARLAAAYFHLYQMLRLPQTAAMMLPLLPALFYTASQSDRAAARAGTVLLTAACLALLLLPVSGIRTAHLSALYENDSVSAGFLREWQASGELLLLPLLRQSQTTDSAARAVSLWAIGKAVILPALVLFGTMQNARLTHYRGSPFFLLLSRTPLSDAVRTDGLWMLFAYGCGVFCMACCLQAAKLHTARKYAGIAVIFPPFLIAALLLYQHAQLADAFGILCAAAAILLPLFIRITQSFCNRQSAGKESA